MQWNKSLQPYKLPLQVVPATAECLLGSPLHTFVSLAWLLDENDGPDYNTLTLATFLAPVLHPLPQNFLELETLPATFYSNPSPYLPEFVVT
ncbi:hypothetical protein SDC9_185260 [bioreactor metagenome]|uniref:Uncharacterized protein n=1 Tax=bioreactor metagenome TaxID=1076179 RepID=A0A645HHS1_9ZZZZ